MGKQITYNNRVAIERLWNSGKTYKEISQELGVSYSCIYHDIQMCGGQTDEAGRVIYSADKRQKILDTGRAWTGRASTGNPATLKCCKQGEKMNPNAKEHGNSLKTRTSLIGASDAGIIT